MNIHPEEDDLVVPFLKGNHYDFTPLKATEDWAKNHYKVVGTPTNFLIDTEGRVLFKPRPYNAETARTLELEIAALLRPPPTSRASGPGSAPASPNTR